ncbi:hypothetical protein EON77_03745 [bacterium]|nr:MAG: hypothetical protein EON77_03745 [bacterium]
MTGCAQVADPNDLVHLPGEDRPKATQRILSSALDYLDARFHAGEISDGQRQVLIQTRMNELVQAIDPQEVQDEDLWIYGDLLRSTGRWKEAADVLKQAAERADGWDRRVNDTLRYASCLAHLGKVDEAIKAARGVYNAPDRETAPILPATLYELVPAAQGQGHDPELAKLLEDAIACQTRTEVDAKSDEGKMFLAASKWHVRRARKTIDLLRAGVLTRT